MTFSAFKLIEKLVIASPKVHTAAGDLVMGNHGVAVINKTSGAATQVTLPARSKNGDFAFVKDGKGDAGTNHVTIIPDATTNNTTIDGQASFVLSVNYGAALFLHNGTEWSLLGVYDAPLSLSELAFLDGVTAGAVLASKALVADASRDLATLRNLTLDGNLIMGAASFAILARATPAAAGTNQGTATALTAQINAVTGADGTTGVALPAATTSTGPILIINTVSSSPLFVYPVNSGDDQINGLSANTAWELGAGEAAWFVPISGTQWYTPVPMNRFNAEIVTTTNVITASENGKTFYLNNATGFVSTLPAPAKGLRYTFISITANTSGNHTVVTNSSANIIKGNQNSVAGDAGDFGTADDTISFVANQSVAGDKVEVHSDGTSWFAYAISKVAAGITFTQAS